MFLFFCDDMIFSCVTAVRPAVDTCVVAVLTLQSKQIRSFDKLVNLRAMAKEL